MRACHRTRGGAAAVLGFLAVVALPAVVQAGVIGALVPGHRDTEHAAQPLLLMRS